MRKVILKAALFFILSITLLKCLCAGGLLAMEKEITSVDQLIMNLKDYFYSYYSLINDKGVIKPKEDVLKEIKTIISGWLPMEGSPEDLVTHDIDDLSIRLESNLKKYGKSINIFTTDASEIVNCWLGDLVEDSHSITKIIWDKEVSFVTKVIDNLTIRDFTSFLSAGKEAIDVGTRQDTIYYNLEAYRMRASLIWDFFNNRQGKQRQYDPSRANRLRKKLYYKTWLNLYLDSIKNTPDLEEARLKFIDKAIVVLKENSLYHEIGHIYADKYLRLNDDTEEETVAFLTELRYGTLSCESLETIIAAAYQSHLSNYNLAGREIISSFIAYIKNQQKNKNSAYKSIEIKTAHQATKMENLFKLTEEQIRLISEYIYKEKLAISCPPS